MISHMGTTEVVLWLPFGGQDAGYGRLYAVVSAAVNG